MHLYAAEYWTDYLLSDAKIRNGLDTDSSLFRLASQLAGLLSEKCSLLAEGEGRDKVEARLLDERLSIFEQHGELHGHILRSLKARSLSRLEKEFLEKQGESYLSLN